jgi:DNA-binding HxlR family transcriptional regulator
MRGTSRADAVLGDWILQLVSASAKNALAKHYTNGCNICMDQLTDVLKAISHPTRRAIIGRLAKGPARFLDIAEPFDIALNAVTKHLKMLERAGLIERKSRDERYSFRFVVSRFAK